MSDHPTRKPKKSETLEVRLPHDTKQEFLTACREDGTTASEVVRGSIQSYLDGRLRPEPQTQTAKILTMIPQPIRKKRYLAAGVGALGLAALAALPSAADPDMKSVFQKLDRNGDGVLSADEFGGPSSGPDSKNVVVERRIVKNADGSTTTTETISPSGLTLPPGAPQAGETQVRVKRIEKRVEGADDAGAADGAPSVSEDAVAYWLPGGADKDGKGDHHAIVAERQIVKMYKHDGDAAPATEDVHPSPFGAFDADGDGKISFAEFSARQTAMLTRGFEILDANGDKSLSQAEYAKIGDSPMPAMKGAPTPPTPPKVDDVPKLSTDQLKAAFKSLDKNNDGKLSLQEYLPPA
jgi:Ca2+-binding EF-hand superfamily protein